MVTTIQIWGNSQAIRLPKGILEAADLHENERVEINAENNIIFVKKMGKKHRKLEERQSGYTGDYKPS